MKLFGSSPRLHLRRQTDLRVFLKATPGADLAQLRIQLVGLVKPYLVVSVQNGSELADAAAALPSIRAVRLIILDAMAQV